MKHIKRAMSVSVIVATAIMLLGVPASASTKTVIQHCQSFTATSSISQPTWRHEYGNGIFYDGSFRISNGCNGAVTYESEGTRFNSRGCSGFQYEIQRPNNRGGYTWVFGSTFRACGGDAPVFLDRNTSSPDDVDLRVYFWCWADPPVNDGEWCLGNFRL